jgi:hypothetical protein
MTLPAAHKEVLRRMSDGPVWMRSFQPVKQTVHGLINQGYLERVAPPMGRARNMVCLSDKGRAAIGLAASQECTIDRFAERLSEHGDINRAAGEVGISNSYGAMLFRSIVERLGAHAA